MTSYVVSVMTCWVKYYHLLSCTVQFETISASNNAISEKENCEFMFKHIGFQELHFKISCNMWYEIE